MREMTGEETRVSPPIRVCKLYDWKETAAETEDSIHESWVATVNQIRAALFEILCANLDENGTRSEQN